MDKQSPSRGGGTKSPATTPGRELPAPIPAALFCFGPRAHEVHGSRPLQGNNKDWGRAIMSLRTINTRGARLCSVTLGVKLGLAVFLQLHAREAVSRLWS